MNYSITRFTGIDYANKSARWYLVKETHTQESALAHCKSLNLNQPYYHRVEVSSKRCPELPRFTVIKPNMKSNYEPVVIPASFTVRKKYNFFQKFIKRFFWCPSSSISFIKIRRSLTDFSLTLLFMTSTQWRCQMKITKFLVVFFSLGYSIYFGSILFDALYTIQQNHLQTLSTYQKWNLKD